MAKKGIRRARKKRAKGPAPFVDGFVPLTRINEAILSLAVGRMLAGDGSDFEANLYLAPDGGFEIVIKGEDPPPPLVSESIN